MKALDRRSEDPLHALLTRAFDGSDSGRLQLRPIERPTSSSAGAGPRRGFLRAAPSRHGVLVLTRRDGVLRWESPAAAGGFGPGRAGRAAVAPGAVVRQFVFEKLPPSEVRQALNALDLKLTPLHTSQPLRELRGLRADQHVPFAPARFPDLAGKRVLLFIHGTFSSGDMFREELAAAPEDAGGQLLAAASKKYDFLLTFDHPTVGVSPALNAFDLAALLKAAPAAVDVVAHSRGGLVTRWWFEGFADPRTRLRAVLVGSPLAGTSLAAPARLRSGLNLISNVAEVLQTVSSAAAALPLMTAAGVLMGIIRSVTAVAASTPLIDAAVAMIPGLDAQSRAGTNGEIARLRQNTGRAGLEYSAVQSNFVPQSPGWAFWRYFVRPLEHLGHAGADLVFEDKNDLVVDTSSMTELADEVTLPLKRVLDFRTSATVHHTNYFRQAKTIQFIRDAFDLH
jgi:hypothetical protein